MKVTLQAQTAEKHPAPSLPVLTPVGEYTLFFLCLAAQRTKLSHSCECFQEILLTYFLLKHFWAWKWRSCSLSCCSPLPLELSNIVGIFIPSGGFINVDMVIWVTVVDQQWQDKLADHAKFLFSLSYWALYLFRQGMYRWRPFCSHQNEWVTMMDILVLCSIQRQCWTPVQLMLLFAVETVFNVIACYAGIAC